MRASNFWVLVFLATPAGFCGPLQESQAPSVFTERSVFQRYCFGCHNTRLKSGGLALDAANLGNPEAQPEVWEKVIRRIRTRSMPPADSLARTRRPTVQ